MVQYTIKAGATSQIIPVSIYDSSSTTGAKLAGLVYNSAGLTAYYNRTGAAGAATSITLATATKGTWATGGFIAIDGTNMPGDYELDIPDAAIASGATSVLVQLKGATNMVSVNILIELTAFDLQTASVAQSGDSYARLGAAGAGLTALGDTRIVNLDAAVTSRMATYTQPTGFLSATFPSGTVANTTNIATVGSVTSGVTVSTNNDKTGYGLSSAAIQSVWDALTSALTTVGSVGKRIVDYVDAAISTRSTYAGGAVASVTAAVTVGTNNDKTGYTVSTVQDKTGYTVSTVQDKTGYSLTNIDGYKKNTAFNNFEFFMRDSVDHLSAKTGLTVTPQRSIDGAAFGACSNTVTEVSNGIYKINLSATDLNGDSITFMFSATGADTTIIHIKTNQ